jgi:hypothetical protein
MIRPLCMAALAFVVTTTGGLAITAVLGAEELVCQSTPRADTLHGDCAGTWANCVHPSGTPATNCCNHMHTTTTQMLCVLVGSATTKQFGTSTPKKRKFVANECAYDPSTNQQTGACTVPAVVECDHTYYDETCIDCTP